MIGVDYIKPSKEDRIAFTYSKEQQAIFLEKLRSLGIPILLTKGVDKSFKDIEQYSFEHLLDFLVSKIINLEKEIEDLKKVIG